MITERFTADLHCVKCDQLGTALWEEDRLENGAVAGPAKLIALSSGFYHVGVSTLGIAKIICVLCDRIIAD